MTTKDVFIRLTRDEIQDEIPYGLICTARESCVWETGKRKRMWNDKFSESEKKACTKLFSIARSWFLTQGVPDTVMMSVDTFNLWKKLGDFCRSL